MNVTSAPNVMKKISTAQWTNPFVEDFLQTKQLLEESIVWTNVPFTFDLSINII